MRNDINTIDLHQACQKNVPTQTSSYDISRQLGSIKVPQFSGDKGQYEHWKQFFEVAIDKTGLSFTSKMLRLREALTGDAEELIKGLGFGKESYEEALRLLDEEYGGDRRYLTKYLDELRNMRTIQCGNTKEIRKFLNMLRATNIAFKERGKETELEDGMFYNVSKSKLSRSGIAFFKRWIVDLNKPDSLSSLVEWLTRELKVLVEAEEVTVGMSTSGADKRTFKDDRTFRNTRFREMSKETKPTQTFQASHTAFPQSCPLKDGNHRVTSCQQFRLLSIPERYQVCKEKRLCYR
jgi:hypothetical protein